MRIIGPGFGRTGTMSMRAALESLGFGPCYHMMEVFARPDHQLQWRAAGRGEAVDWVSLFEGYESTLDWPACNFWRELCAAFPDAKVLLTTRDADRWYDSCDRTVFEAMRRYPPDDEMVLPSMVHEVIAQRNFSGRLDDRDHCTAVFRRHVAEVVEEVPADRLLVYEVGAGWDPLCDFLGVEVPGEPFPRVNDTEQFRAMFGIDD